MHLGKKLRCSEADVVKGCVGTSDSCARREACEQQPLLSCSEHKAGHSTAGRIGCLLAVSQVGAGEKRASALLLFSRGEK